MAAPTAASSGAPKNVRRAEAERLVKAADRARRRHGHADDEQRDQQERAGERHRQVEGHARPPRCPAAIDSQSGNDQRQRDEQPAGPADRRQARRRTSRRRARAAPASVDGSTRSSRVSVAAERAPGSPARTNRTHQRGQRADAPRWPPAHFTAANAAGFGRRMIAAEDEDVRRQQHQHRQHVEHALEDDRGERAGRAHALVPREEVRANDLAGARRQHAAARQSRPRSRETRCRSSRAPSGSSRYCQRQRANRQVHEHRRERQQRASRAARARSRATTPPQVDVVQEQRDAGRRASARTTNRSKV